MKTTKPKSMTMIYFTSFKFQVKTFVLIVIFFTGILSNLNAQNRYADSLALVALYEATDGPNWTNSQRNIQKWLQGPINTWYGVKVVGDRVTMLNLPNNKLKGQIPIQLCNINTLQRVYFNDNLLSGPIPSGLRPLNYENLYLTIYRNLFNFNDIANYTNTLYKDFWYAPQKQIDLLTKSYNGNAVTVLTTNQHPANHYTWFINNNPVENYDSCSFTIVPTSTIEIFVQVSNDVYTNNQNIAQKLIVQSNPIVVDPVSPEIKLIVNNPKPVCSPSTIDITSPEITLGSSESLSFSYFRNEDLSDQLSFEEAKSINQSGTYFIKGTDENGLSESKPVVVSISQPPALSGIITHVSCIDDNTGAIDLSITNGFAPYSFKWSDGSISEDLTSLPKGDYSVEVTNANGCLSSLSFSILLKDIDIPIVKAKNISIGLDENGTASITAEQINDGSYDNCEIDSISVYPSDFNCSSIGANQVTLTVTDVNGNTTNAQATVTIEDKTAPVAIAKNLTIQLDENGAASITSEQINDGSYDNCGIASITVSPSNFDFTKIGQNQVTLTVIDVNGNTTNAQATVTIEDKTAPVAIAKNLTIQLDENGAASITAEQINDGSYDNCGIASITVSPSNFDFTKIGQNQVTLTVTDVNGNTTNAQATVTIEDKTAPVAIAKNLTIQLDDNGAASITAEQINDGSYDNCGIASITVFPFDFDCSSIGTNQVTLTVNDVNGNTTNAQATVTIEDKTAPVAIAKNLTIQLDDNGKASINAEQINDGSNDNCGIASITVSPSNFDFSKIGQNQVTLTVTDVNGNTAYAQATVTIEDKTAPVAIAKNLTIQLDDNGAASITAEQINDGSYDNCGIASISVSPSNFDFSKIGQNQVTLTVTDVNGNTANAQATVTIEDKTAPVAIAKNLTIQLDENGAASINAEQINDGSYDNCGIASITVFPSDFDCSSIGTNQVTLTVNDVNGNTASAQATVTIEDNTNHKAVAKSITIPLDENGNATITADQIDNGSTDACGIVSMNVTPSAFDCSNIGDNSVTLVVIDASGNVLTAQSTVTVVENSEHKAIAKDITIQLNEAGSVSISAQQVDNGSTSGCGIASIDVVPSTFDCGNLGENSVTLKVTDLSGNLFTDQATVTVQDKIAPSIIAPAAITKTFETKNCGTGGGVTVDLGTPVVSDNCSIKKVSNNAPKTFPYGVTIVTWTATDISGNSSTATQRVEIIKGSNNAIPVINSITSNSPVYIRNSANLTATFTDDNLKTAIWYWGDGSSSSGKITGNTITGSHYYRETGIYGITLTITDSYGKSATKDYWSVVVFDPAEGDITGGGWMTTEKGEYTLKSTCEKGNFGFTAQYDKKLNLKGNFTFHLNNVNFHVNSTSLDWLLINDDHALFTGNAKVNNQSGYRFWVSAVDSDMKKSCHNKTDLLHIIVWNSYGEVIFDNQSEIAAGERPTEPISQGSIVIHGGKKKCDDSNYKSINLNENTPIGSDLSLFDNLKVYPNPATNILHIEIPEREEQPVSFDIVSASGKVILRAGSLQLYGQYGWIDLDNLNMAPGVYILKLNEITGSGTSVIRFIKK